MKIRNRNLYFKRNRHFRLLSRSRNRLPSLDSKVPYGSYGAYGVISGWRNV